MIRKTIQNNLIGVYLLFIILLIIGQNSFGQTTIKTEMDRITVSIEEKIIGVPDNVNYMFTEHHIFQDTLLYASSGFQRNEIHILNLKDETFIKTIKIPDFISKNREIDNISVQSSDSIFFIFHGSTEFLLINSSGSVIQKWSSKELQNHQRETPVTVQANFNLQKNYIDWDKEIIHCIVSEEGVYDFLGRQNINRHGVFDLKNKSWKYFYGEYKGILKEKGNKLAYFYDMQSPYQCIVGNRNYITYPIDPSVYIYNNKSGECIGNKTLIEKKLQTIRRPISLKSDDRKFREVKINSDYYGPLVYHKKLNLFSRWYRFVKNKGIILVEVYDEELHEVDNFRISDPNVQVLIGTADGYLVTKRWDRLEENRVEIGQLLISRKNR